jgi:uncharacterized protein (DUF433 family)
MNYQQHITIDPHIRSGKPCIKGTRIAVADVFDYLGGGMTVAEVLDNFLNITADHIQASFALNTTLSQSQSLTRSGKRYYRAFWIERQFTVPNISRTSWSYGHEVISSDQWIFIKC